MESVLKRLLIKSKLFAPIGIAIIVSIFIITIQAIYNSKQSIYNSVENSLSLEIETIIKMLEREKNLKLEKVKTHLEVAHDYFYQRHFEIKNDSIKIIAINQLTGENHKLWIKKWLLNNKSLEKDHNFVDKIKQLTGGTATIFQKIDSGYLRVSTNVPNNESSRALNTYIPNNSPVVRAIEQGTNFFGRAYVVNDWYITAYEPIIKNGKPVGILYVGNKEKDLPELRRILNQIKISKNGALFIMDENGDIIISPEHEGENWYKKDYIKHIIKNKKGLITHQDKVTGKKQILVFDYFKDFKLYVVAAVWQEDETNDLIKNIINQSVLYGIVILVLLSLFVYFITTKNLHNYLKQLEISNKKLSTFREAFEQSENKFRTLFNNSSDEVFLADFRGRFIEVNQIACDSLGYTREELLKMQFLDIKTKKFIPYISENLNIIKEKGYHTYETEHVSKSGQTALFEMKSRAIDYEGKKLILTIARNISDRKAMEKKIMQTIIKTEMKERKRFSSELHDGLGPILSTIKLYSDLIKKGNFNKLSLKEAVSNIDELVEMAIATTKEISNNITPNVLDDFGLSVAINEFCTYVSRTKSVNIKVNTKKFTLTNLKFEASILYQAVKELINNTLRHADAKNIKIELKSQNKQIILYYRDDGKGFDVEEMLKESTGLGLNNIVNKIKTMKGICDFNSRPDEGMFVLISLTVEGTEQVAEKEQSK